MASVDTCEHPVLLFDGVCNLCNGFVQFVIRRDPEGAFRFAPLQSAVASELLADAGCEGVAGDLETVVLVEDGECYTKSDAALRVGRRLGLPYRLAFPLRHLPRWFRDGVYDVVAEYRYQVFGRRDECMVPTPERADRFLAETE